MGVFGGSGSKLRDCEFGGIDRALVQGSKGIGQPNGRLKALAPGKRQRFSEPGVELEHLPALAEGLALRDELGVFEGGAGS